MVAMEELNDRKMRLFAVELLHHIGESMGIRQARAVADIISAALHESSGQAPEASQLADPLIPFC